MILKALRQGKKDDDPPAYLNITLFAVAWILVFHGFASAQQPITPIDFRPFVDGRNWIVRQPLVYTIGVSKDSITVHPAS
jgi:hypothetical protein